LTLGGDETAKEKRGGDWPYFKKGRDTYAFAKKEIGVCWSQDKRDGQECRLPPKEQISFILKNREKKNRRKPIRKGFRHPRLATAY